MLALGVLGLLAFAVALESCAAPAQRGAGEPCNSLSECTAGLSCIEGVCDDDLTSIAGQVPVFTMEPAMGGAAAADGGGARAAEAVASTAEISGGAGGAGLAIDASAPDR